MNSRARFSKAPVINGPVKLLLFTCKIEVSVGFISNMIKLSVSKIKWSSLLARTRALILYITIWIFDLGPVKLPGLSRNGPLATTCISLPRYQLPIRNFPLPKGILACSRCSDSKKWSEMESREKKNWREKEGIELFSCFLSLPTLSLFFPAHLSLCFFHYLNKLKGCIIVVVRSLDFRPLIYKLKGIPRACLHVGGDPG